ncbi:MAG: hypothetical protein M3441_28695, partial [Chloroflexota bacterium]|nr:hypothetical protein [Chloroflexota bacterium]
FSSVHYRCNTLLGMGDMQTRANLQRSDTTEGRGLADTSVVLAPDLFFLEVTGGLAQALRLIGFMIPVRSSIVA